MCQGTQVKSVIKLTPSIAPEAIIMWVIDIVLEVSELRVVLLRLSRLLLWSDSQLTPLHCVQADTNSNMQRT